MTSNLPPGTTNADIERQGGCSKCCSSHDASDFEVMDHDEGIATVRGDCDNCGAEVEASARATSPEGEYEVISEWEAEDCRHDERAADDHADQQIEDMKLAEAM